MDRIGILKGILARLELDADLGVEFLSRGKEGIERLERLVGTIGHAQPVRKVALPRAPLRDRDGDTPTSRSASRNDFEPPTRENPAPGNEDCGGGEPEPVVKKKKSVRIRTGAGPVCSRTSLVPFVEPPSHPEKEAALSALKSECMECEECALCEKRNTVVWGEGDLCADVMFIGEGPGRDEDMEGRPFVGRSGRLLTDIIEKGMKIPRTHVYIANVVKCRPPGNRDPYVDEVMACSRYLDRQIEVIAPKIIVAVGNVAGRTLLRDTGTESGLRGKWHEYSGIPLRVIYHPSYLLRLRRSESDRTHADKATWRDIQDVMARAGSPNRSGSD